MYVAKQYNSMHESIDPLQDLGGGEQPRPPQGVNPITNQRISLWYYFMTSILGRPTLKFSKSALGANIYLF